MAERDKSKGAVWTPQPIAELLVSWAIRSPAESVLDLGCGEGVFLLEAAKRLESFGASRDQICNQLFGTELDFNAYRKLQGTFKRLLGRSLPHVYRADFFKTDFPKVDAVIGNPPYVRRWWLSDLDEIRHTVAETAINFSRSTDLACYFVVHASKFLKVGGRMALIITDSWLDMDYGVNFKRFLTSHFKIHAIIGFDAKVFPEHLIKTVLLLAEKRSGSQQRDVRSNTAFIRWKALPKENKLCWSAEAPEDCSHHTSFVVKAQIELQPKEPWGKFLYAPPAYFRLADHPKMTPLHAVATTRIGFQSFCKRFYVVPAGSQWQIERQYLRPLIYSPKDSSKPVLSNAQPAKHYLLYCSEPKSKLSGMNILKYIEWGESQRIHPRGNTGEVIGFDNLPRVKRANRQPWYNLVPEVDRRGSWPVLLFRRIFKRYAVIWNEAGWIANENFIELKPRSGVHLSALLGFLNSSFAELLFRVHAHRYGGGVYNLNPGEVGSVPVLNIPKLSAQETAQLAGAYKSFIASEGRNREVLDQVVAEILNVEGLSLED